MTANGPNPNTGWITGAIVAVSLLILGGFGTLILFNLSQLASKVDALQVIVYDTKSVLKVQQDRQEELLKQISEQKGALDAALGKTRR